MTLPPLALYVHVPWCVRKCPYCDFNSHAAAPGALPEEAYIDALIADLEADLPLVANRTLTSIFIGGGTPSLFSGEAYARLLSAIKSRVPLDEAIEITLEANPGTVERVHFEGYRAAGINRLSLGVQSFDDAALERLGRIHGGHDAEQAVALARRAGFDNLNIDLMHGLPGQSVAGAMTDIERALALTPEHLSWYQLTLEPNTVFHARPPVLPEEEVLADIQDAGHDRLETAGLARYEISAYARPGRASRHNLNYWHFGDYLGIGAGAHGKLSAPDGNGGLAIERRWKTRHPDDYLRRFNDPRGFVGGHRSIPADERPLEFLMNALRLVEGVPRHEWKIRTGLDEAILDAHTERAQQMGLLERGPTQLKATPQGLLFLNDLLAMCDEADAT
ncbi:radical SAM family heme chaperone HemW [Kushneria phosphatilytica]|uniref:Heme chaperone HemW n=1 Tax=Kushneria phosphatilytica TaxID=657387 RepID=A0A1S1NTZ2_9GAMM|nr:radical SAM family heme chaperone HemW [Kushneria phosphatilytica]OHV08899.1 YggW family oxidoreductase [Kushneria phosphatilytica]QEL12620.1 radical SAM family heme chaperone HemW [Kushneria phosphatilytica]